MEGPRRIDMREYFELELSELQNAVEWALGFVEEALAVYERHVPKDPRPRDALAAAKEFSTSGRRTRALRKAAMDAYRASRSCDIAQASYAANSASLLAALAFTHPFNDPRQAAHVLGPVVYAILAVETETGDRDKGNMEIDRAIATADAALAALLEKFPRQEGGRKRAEEVFHRLDSGIISGDDPTALPARRRTPGTDGPRPLCAQGSSPEESGQSG